MAILASANRTSDNVQLRISEWLAVLHALGTIGELCKANDLPCLNSIVVAKKTQLPGHAVVLREGRTRKQEIKAVARQDWFQIRHPTVRMFRQIREALYELEPGV